MSRAFSQLDCYAGSARCWSLRETTEGRIDFLTTPEELGSTVALLVKSIYFEGSWTDRLDAAQTAVADFRRPDGSTVSAPLMHKRGWAKFAGGEGYVAVDPPYGARAFSMTVVIPSGSTTLDELVDGLDPARWGEIVGDLRELHGKVWLPRFELTYANRLDEVLRAMGMRVAFDPGRADFGRLVEGAGPGTGPWIEWVKQKTFVNVHEVGTEAAAVTGVALGISTEPERRADRPFLFAIRERFSGTILFIGTVTDPSVP